MSTKPYRLYPEFHERVWGVRDLSPWFDYVPEKATGEAWFQTPDIPLLVKFLFTSEKLSVQVHPDDSYALEHHQCSGKTEAWHVIGAAPDAAVALGLKREMSREEAQDAFESGAIMDLLEWHPARVGDTFIVKAGTVHAIGAGLRIVEIQQQSDITYRLYDYGRGRELHLADGLVVADLGPYRWPQPREDGVLADCEYFRFERLKPGLLPASPDPRLVVVSEGQARIDAQALSAGHVCVIPSGCETRIDAAGTALLCSVPPKSM